MTVTCPHCQRHWPHCPAFVNNKLVLDPEYSWMTVTSLKRLNTTTRTSLALCSMPNSRVPIFKITSLARVWRFLYLNTSASGTWSPASNRSSCYLTVIAVIASIRASPPRQQHLCRVPSINIKMTIISLICISSLSWTNIIWNWSQTLGTELSTLQSQLAFRVVYNNKYRVGTPCSSKRLSCC